VGIDYDPSMGVTLTKNFRLKQFHSHDGSIMPNEVFQNVKELANNLQVLRDTIKLPIKVKSGYRSPEHNASVGGVANSQHLTGKASDISVTGMSPKQVADTIIELISKGKMKQGGIGVYRTFVHYDIRGNEARWNA
jgi:uncharacterized protein YcbK (DUF882 family)